MTGPPDHVTERQDGTIDVGKRPDEHRKTEIKVLEGEVNWNNAPDWARLLYLQIKQFQQE